MPQRVWDIVGCGAFCVTDETSALDEVLESGRHLVSFDGYDELPAICEKFLENAELRDEITVEGYKAVSTSHTVLLRALEIVKLILSEKLS